MSDIHIYIEREQPVKVITLEPSGKRGPAGPNSVTSATTSDGTAEIKFAIIQVGDDQRGLEICNQGGDIIGVLGKNFSQVPGSSSYSFSFGENSSSENTHSYAIGESCRATSNGSFAMGLLAKSLHQGAFVFNDASPDELESTQDNEFSSHFTNGYRFLGGSATFSAGVTVDGTLTADHIHGNLAGSVYAHVRAGETLAKGDPVYISGSHGSGANLIPIVSKADASNAAKMPAVGIMDAALANNANGHMVIIGTITQLNTNAYAVNSVLYVASGGGFTATPPAANSQAVAIVERSNANNGAVIVKVNGLASNGGNGASDANKLVRFGSAGTIPVASIGGLGTNVAAFLATPTSANLAAAVTDETGSGSIVFATSPTITTPTLSGTTTSNADIVIANFAEARGYRLSDGTVNRLFCRYEGTGTGVQTGYAAYIRFGTGANDIRIYDGSSATVPVMNFVSGNVSMGTDTPSTKAVLTLASTTRGFLPPRMTTAQRDAITSVPAGLVIHNTTTNKLNEYNGTSWVEFVVNGGTATDMTLAGTTTESPHSIGNSGTAITLNLANGTFQSVTMTGNCTFTMPTATTGRSFTLRVSTGAGGFTGTFTGVKWSGNVAPVLTTTASRLDIIAFVADGTNWYGVITQNFTP